MNQKEQQKQADERAELDWFLEKAGIQPSKIEPGPVINGANKPDFIAITNDRTIGIELTGFYHTSTGSTSRQQVESAWEQIRIQFQEKRKIHPKIHEIGVFIKLKELRLPPKRDHELFIDQMINFTIENINNENITRERKRFSDFQNMNYSLLNEYVNYLDLNNAGCFISPHCADTSVAKVGVNEEDLINTIQHKLNKYSCSSKFDELWLLITCGPQLSQCMGCDPVDIYNGFLGLNKITSQGPFDRIYIYQYMYDRVILWNGRAWVEITKANLK